MPQKIPFFGIFSISFSKMRSTKMFHTLTKHISRITTKKHQKTQTHQRPTKNKEQNIDNRQNLLCATCAQGTLFSTNYRQWTVNTSSGVMFH